MKVKNILTDTNGKTLGATIIKDDGTELKLKTQDLLKAKVQRYNVPTCGKSQAISADKRNGCVAVEQVGVSD